jgi:hypothetical protein
MPLGGRAFQESGASGDGGAQRSRRPPARAADACDRVSDTPVAPRA